MNILRGSGIWASAADLEYEHNIAGRSACAITPMGAGGAYIILPADPHVQPSGGGGHNFKKSAVEVATVELFCFLCHNKDKNYAYTSVAGWRQYFGSHPLSIQCTEVEQDISLSSSSASLTGGPAIDIETYWTNYEIMSFFNKHKIKSVQLFPLKVFPRYHIYVSYLWSFCRWP